MRRIECLFLALMTAVFVGCNGGGGDYKSTADLKKAPAVHDEHGHEHGHGAKGPHGGSIVELGDEQYHAEVVLDEHSHSVQVYMLGKDAKTASPVAATEISIKPEGKDALKLKAVPQEGDGEGKASKFEIVDEKFVHDVLDAKFLHGSLSIVIGETPFSGHVDMHLDGDAHHEHKDEAPKAGESKEEPKAEASKVEETKPSEGDKKEEPAKPEGESK